MRRGFDTAATPTSFTYDAAGNLTCDGRFIYQYDAWSRLVEVRLGTYDTANGWYVPGPVVKAFAYDGLGRLIRTLSPFPTPELATGEYRSERYYYDGLRRVAEVVTDPVASIERAIAYLSPEELGTLEIPGAILGSPGDLKDAPLWFETRREHEQ